MQKIGVAERIYPDGREKSQEVEYRLILKEE